VVAEPITTRRVILIAVNPKTHGIFTTGYCLQQYANCAYAGGLNTGKTIFDKKVKVKVESV
jgi:hypothetical protein